MNWFFVTFSDEDRAEDAEVATKGAGLFLHIKVDDIEDFHSGVVSKGMKPTSEPRERRDGGREFMLRDPDGYKLVFFERSSTRGMGCV